MHNHDTELVRRVEATEAKLREHDVILSGERGNFGVMHKVDVLWKITVGIVCSLMGALGVWLMKVFKINP